MKTAAPFGDAALDAAGAAPAANVDVTAGAGAGDRAADGAGAGAGAGAGDGAVTAVDAPDRARHPWLLADIGGTNARFGWVASAGAPVSHVSSLAVADHASPAAAAQAYLRLLQDTLGADYRPPRAGAWAVATPVAGDEVAFTNSGWTFSRAGTQRQLQLDTLLVLNDFEALALSLPRLEGAQLQGWPGGPALTQDSPRHTLAVIGPGTGLGVAGLVPAPGDSWIAMPGEGGHSTLAPGDDFESEVLAFARRAQGAGSGRDSGGGGGQGTGQNSGQGRGRGEGHADDVDDGQGQGQGHGTGGHVSAERLLSGMGLPLLHRAVCAVRGTPVPAADVWTAARIVEQALAGSDAGAVHSIDCFCAMLGGFAGNVALLTGARGGVFIGGGIVPRLGDQFFASRFRQRFEAKGRMQGYLAAIPTLLITDTLAALSGTAHALEMHRQ